MDPDTSELDGFVAVARAHREHERYHSLFKLEEAVAWRRDANALKVLADHWSGASGMDQPPADPSHGAVGCTDLNAPAVVATTGILFMEGAPEPAELTAMRAGWNTTAIRYRKVSQWLAEQMNAEWPRLSRLLTPALIESARARFTALTNTTSAGHVYALVANLLSSATQTLTNQDLTPAGIRRDRTAAANMIRTAAWLADMAAAEVAKAGATLTLSDPAWTEFIHIAETRTAPNTTG